MASSLVSKLISEDYNSYFALSDNTIFLDLMIFQCSGSASFLDLFRFEKKSERDIISYHRFLSY